MQKSNYAKRLTMTPSFQAGSIALCLALLLLGGCASEPVTRVVPLLPPQELLRSCQAPTFAGETNGALLDHALMLRQTLDQCDADKSALREWATKSPE